MFGSFFIFTQYLQSVLGYTPLGAGVRMLPWAAAYMVSATQSAKLVERFGQRRVVTSGLVIVAAGLALLRVRHRHARYGLVAAALVVMALGMGMTTAPSTGAIMRSLPLHKAGVGSAVNDTTRELGGALGVAVLRQPRRIAAPRHDQRRHHRPPECGRAFTGRRPRPRRLCRASRVRRSPTARATPTHKPSTPRSG